MSHCLWDLMSLVLKWAQLCCNLVEMQILDEMQTETQEHEKKKLSRFHTSGMNWMRPSNTQFYPNKISGTHFKQSSYFNVHGTYLTHCLNCLLMKIKAKNSLDNFSIQRRTTKKWNRQQAENEIHRPFIILVDVFTQVTLINESNEQQVLTKCQKNAMEDKI